MEVRTEVVLIPDDSYFECRERTPIVPNKDVTNEWIAQLIIRDHSGHDDCKSQLDNVRNWLYEQAKRHAENNEKSKNEEKK